MNNYFHHNLKFLLFIILCIVSSLVNFPKEICATESRSLPDQQLLKTTYGGDETLEYEISWLGITAGKLTIQKQSVPQQAEQFNIRVTAKSAGLLAVFYPIEDLFVTLVQGEERLPVRLDFWQKEGKRKNYRVTTYDQEQFVVSSKKNDGQPSVYTLSGPVHNEFSSFFAMRAMPLEVGKELMVPTFADKKRNEVKVSVQEKDKRSSIFGEVDTVKVIPHLHFKGLYEKLGDPVIWMTDDEYRVPVRIKAKIVIGSFTATLVNYQGAKPMPPAQQHQVSSAQ